MDGEAKRILQKYVCLCQRKVSMREAKSILSKRIPNYQRKYRKEGWKQEF